MKLEYDLIKGETIPSFKDVIRIVEPKEIDHYVIRSYNNKFDPQTINVIGNLNIILTQNASNADVLYFKFFDKDGNVVIPKFEAYSTSYGAWSSNLFATTTCGNEVSLLYYPQNKISALNSITYDGRLLINGTGGFSIYINSTNASITQLNLTS